MLKGLYQAAGGMKVRMAKQDVIANNLANASTAGFQREIAAVQAAPGAAAPAGAAPGAAPPHVLQLLSRADRRGGTVSHTGARHDIALEGPGYLLAGTAAGQRLFRGGELKVNAQGQLTTPSGEPLLGTDGNPIRVGQEAFQVEPDGTVKGKDAVIGRLRVVLATGATQREGASLMAAAGMKDAPQGTVRVLQGALERSNVQPVREMVDMIAGVRAYETAQRTVTAQDGTLERLLTILQR